MEVDQQNTSCFWQIEVRDMDAKDFDADDAFTAGLSLTMVLRRAAVTSPQLQAHVYTHTLTNPYYDSADDVTYRWREPKLFTVHALVHIVGDVGLSELDFREKLFEAMDGMHPSYLDKYHSWDFTRIDEDAFTRLCDENVDRADTDDV